MGFRDYLDTQSSGVREMALRALQRRSPQDTSQLAPPAQPQPGGLSPGYAPSPEVANAPSLQDWRDRYADFLGPASIAQLLFSGELTPEDIEYLNAAPGALDALEQRTQQVPGVGSFTNPAPEDIQIDLSKGRMARARPTPSMIIPGLEFNIARR